MGYLVLKKDEDQNQEMRAGHILKIDREYGYFSFPGTQNGKACLKGLSPGYL